MQKNEQLILKNSRETNVMTSFLSSLSRVKILLIVIPFLYMSLLTFIPILSFFRYTFFDQSGFTLTYIVEVLINPLYIKVMFLTLCVAILVTGFSLLVSYPIAYLAFIVKSKFWKKVIIAAVLIPFWISLLVRTFAWNIILQEHGVINTFLMRIGIISEPLQLMYNTTGVVIAMTHILMPYMFLSLYSVMQGIDYRLIQAAQGLGARSLKAFRTVFLPLSSPGILAGSLLVFVLSLGFYITPALLGGSSSTMIAMLIETNINKTLNWHLASALSFILFFFTIFIIMLFFIFFKNKIRRKDAI